MDYAKKIELLNARKDKLQKRLAQISQREKTLASKKRLENRKNENRRKYHLGGIVMTAMYESGIEDFDEAAILGALLKAFEKYDMETLYAYQSAGEKILHTHRHTDQQSASAQGFTKSEINAEVAPTAETDLSKALTAYLQTLDDDA